MQVVFAGLSAGAPVFAMIEIAHAGWSSAVGEDAGSVSRDHMVGECLGWLVGAAAVLEELA
jgi:hypothetical protein